MALSEPGACATLIECRAPSISGLIIIAGFTRYTFPRSILIYTNHSTSMAGPCITCCKNHIIHKYWHLSGITKRCCNLEKNCKHEKYFWNAIVFQRKCQSGVRKPQGKQQLKVIYSQFIICGFLACLHLCCDSSQHTNIPEVFLAFTSFSFWQLKQESKCQEITAVS